MGTGTATRNVKAEVRNTTLAMKSMNGATIPYMLDLGALDAEDLIDLLQVLLIIIHSTKELSEYE